MICGREKVHVCGEMKFEADFLPSLCVCVGGGRGGGSGGGVRRCVDIVCKL